MYQYDCEYSTRDTYTSFMTFMILCKSIHNTHNPAIVIKAYILWNVILLYSFHFVFSHSSLTFVILKRVVKIFFKKKMYFVFHECKKVERLVEAKWMTEFSFPGKPPVLRLAPHLSLSNIYIYKNKIITLALLSVTRISVWKHSQK